MSSNTWKINWEGLNYAPVRGLFERIQRRLLRAQRKVMLRLFTEKGLLDLMARARVIRDISHSHGDRKIALFQKVYDAYIKLVTDGAKAVAGPEAAHTAS